MDTLFTSYCWLLAMKGVKGINLTVICIAPLQQFIGGALSLVLGFQTEMKQTKNAQKLCHIFI